MTVETFQALQVEHSELCARAADLGLVVPADLTVDFDSEEAGRAIVSSLRKLVSGHLAGAAEPEHDSRETAKKPSRAKNTKKTVASAPVEQQQENEMSKTTKTKTTKTASKAKAKGTKKVAAKKVTTKAKRAPKGTGPVAKIAKMLQNGGCTREQVLKATGWKAVSMQQIAKSLGIKLKVDESKRPFRYSAAK